MLLKGNRGLNQIRAYLNYASKDTVLESMFW